MNSNSKEEEEEKTKKKPNTKTEAAIGVVVRVGTDDGIVGLLAGYGGWAGARLKVEKEGAVGDK